MQPFLGVIERHLNCVQYSMLSFTLCKYVYPNEIISALRTELKSTLSSMIPYLGDSQCVEVSLWHGKVGVHYFE